MKMRHLFVKFRLPRIYSRSNPWLENFKVPQCPGHLDKRAAVHRQGIEYLCLGTAKSPIKYFPNQPGT